MASIEESAISEVAAGSGADSVVATPRIFTGAPIRQRDPNSGAPYTNAGLDLHLHNDPDADGDALTVITAGTDPNGLHRSTDPDTGVPTLYGEPSPRRFDVWGAGDADLAASSPVGVVNDENSMGVTDTVTYTMTSRQLPVIITPVINCFGFFQGLDGAAQALSTLFIDITLTVVPDAGIGTPVVTTSEIEVFYGSGGSTSVSLPAVTFDENTSSTYTLLAAVSTRYRGTVSNAFDVSITQLNVGLQCIEYTSV